jgi:hypothetical protein
MGWKYRKGKPYFYRSERIGDKVVSHYCGRFGTENARLWMSLVQLGKERRAQEAAERAIERAEFAELASLPEELAALLAEAQRATAEALQAAGYHQHKRGEWRKRRGTNQNQKPNEEPIT